MQLGTNFMIMYQRRDGWNGSSVGEWNRWWYEGTFRHCFILCSNLLMSSFKRSHDGSPPSGCIIMGPAFLIIAFLIAHISVVLHVGVKILSPLCNFYTGLGPESFDELVHPIPVAFSDHQYFIWLYVHVIQGIVI